MPKPRRLSGEEYVKLGHVVRKQIVRAYRADSCIATSRATLDALRAMNIDAYELPVTAGVVNGPLMAWAEEHGRFPAAGDPDYPEDGWGVGIGVGPEDPADRHGWNGHLVVIAERRWFLDYSLDQASRPDRGIIIAEPIVVAVDERFLRSKGDVGLFIRRGDVGIQYSTAPEKRGYKLSPNWSGQTRPLVTVRTNHMNGEGPG